MSTNTSAHAASEDAQESAKVAVSSASTHPTGGRSARRRGSLQQGYALETLGHAVEYLVDSQMFTGGDREARTEQEAIQVLMRCSREVFAECPEVPSLRDRFDRWKVLSWPWKKAGHNHLSTQP